MRLSKRRVPFSHIMIPHSAPIVKHIYQFSQIFLGFAAKDRYTVAESLLYHLENYGVPVWYDRHDLIIGDNRQKENFEKGIIESKYAIIIFSENTEVS